MLRQLIVSCFCDLGTIVSVGSEEITRSKLQTLRFSGSRTQLRIKAGQPRVRFRHMFDDVLISKELLKLLNRQTSIPRYTAHRECINRIMSWYREDANAI